jgi:hypothetical protein
MSDEERRKETYERIKKRLGDYRYRSTFLTLGTMVCALLFILSLFPLVPAVIAAILGLTYYDWSILLWFVCIAVFGALFWIFQRFSRKIEEKRGITLEEKMYVPAYEALCHFREYMEPNHPIIGSKLKAERRMQYILTLLEQTAFPNVDIVKEQTVQFQRLYRSLRTRIIPSIRKYQGNVLQSLVAFVDYLSAPKLPSLVELNKTMESLPETVERNIYLDFRSALFKRSNLRHTTVFSSFAIFAMLVYYIDINYFDAPKDTAFGLGLMFWVGIAAIYVSYLALTRRKEQRT